MARLKISGKHLIFLVLGKAYNVNIYISGLSIFVSKNYPKNQLL